MDTNKPWYTNCSWDIGGTTLPQWIPFLENIGCTRANLTHREDGLVELELLQQHQTSSLSWTIHLCSKHLRTVPLATFFEHVSRVKNVREVLVVSGNPKPKRTSTHLLKEIIEMGIDTPLAVAVSAHDTPEILAAKLAHKQVKRVYFQLSEPEFLDSALANVRALRPDMAISACWMPPTKANWQALTMFPWKGSALSSRWMESYEYAAEMAQDQLNWMIENGIEPLIEPRRLSRKLPEFLDGFTHESY